MSAGETPTAGGTGHAAADALPSGTSAPGSVGAVGLEPFRRRLDELDEQIARAFGERFQICREIALYKREHEIPMMQPGRVEEVRARYLERGAEVNLPADFTGALFELMIGATCKLEDELIEGAVEAGTDRGADAEAAAARAAAHAATREAATREGAAR